MWKSVLWCNVSERWSYYTYRQALALPGMVTTDYFRLMHDWHQIVLLDLCYWVQLSYHIISNIFICWLQLCTWPNTVLKIQVLIDLRIVHVRVSCASGRRMYIRWSHDYGRNWTSGTEIWGDLAGYSTLTMLPHDRNHLYILYERGITKYFDQIAFTKIKISMEKGLNAEWITTRILPVVVRFKMDLENRI